MQGYRIYNTWMGDPSKIILLEEVLRVIHQDKLIEAARDTGHFLLQGLQELQVWYTCLLYTSPSPRDISGARMTSSA